MGLRLDRPRKLNMKKLITILLTLALLAQPLTAGKRWIVWATASAGPTYTLIASNLANTYVDDWPVGSGDTGLYYSGEYVGIFYGTAYTIGKVEWVMTKSAGDISGKSYRCKIWSDASGNLGTLLGTSTAVTGSNAWSNTTVAFIFPAAVSTSSGAYYHVTLDAAGSDGSNYASITFTNVLTVSGGLGSWTSAPALANNFNGMFQARFALYNTP